MIGAYLDFGSREWLVACGSCDFRSGPHRDEAMAAEVAVAHDRAGHGRQHSAALRRSARLRARDDRTSSA